MLAAKRTRGQKISDSKLTHYRRRVQIMLMAIDTQGPNGQPQLAAAGPLPLTWKFPMLHPLARTVGDDAIADFFLVLEGKPLEFQLPVVPSNFPHK